MPPLPDFPEIPFDLIREPLHNVVRATINKVDREWPEGNSAASGVIVETQLRTAENTYRTILFLVADVPENPARKPEYALSVPPLTRTILDALFTIVFLFEDLTNRTQWYLKSGWRELFEEQERLKQRYGQQDSWQSWLADRGAAIAANKANWGITPAEEAKLTVIKWFPTPSQMRSSRKLSPERRDYLAYLNDWFYRRLSSESHLSWPELAYRSAPLLRTFADEERRQVLLKKQKSDMFAITAVLLLALVSEIETELRYGLGDRMKYVWRILAEHFADAKELYESRYRDRL